jgi:hypothetical protein
MDSDPRETALARASTMYKGESVPQTQGRNCQSAINIWSWAPDGARHQGLLTDRPSVRWRLPTMSIPLIPCPYPRRVTAGLQLSTATRSLLPMTDSLVQFSKLLLVLTSTFVLGFGSVGTHGLQLCHCCPSYKELNAATPWAAAMALSHLPVLSCGAWSPWRHHGHAWLWVPGGCDIGGHRPRVTVTRAYFKMRALQGALI